MESKKVFDLCRSMAARTDVNATDKWLYTFLVLNNVRGHNFSRLKVQTIVDGASMSERTMQTSMRRLVSLGAVARRVTGRAQIFNFPAPDDWKSDCIVDAAKSAGLTRQKLPPLATMQELINAAPGHDSNEYSGPFMPGIGENFCDED